MKFFKGVLKLDLKTVYIPGTVTTNRREAEIWQERIMSRKRRGACKHIRHGDAVLIEFDFPEQDILDSSYFQMAGVHEHSRKNCWTSLGKVKAQINDAVDYRIVL